MLKYCVNQWEQNKEKLRVAFENCIIYSDYEAFARLVIENIFPEWKNYKLDIHYYDEYQGEVVFFIHSDPWAKEGLFLSYLDYGSCSVCDALQAAAEEVGEERVNDMMAIALNFIQHMTHPYPSIYNKKYDECCR